jgi:hypothetical protein
MRKLLALALLAPLTGIACSDGDDEPSAESEAVGESAARTAAASTTGVSATNVATTTEAPMTAGESTTTSEVPTLEEVLDSRYQSGSCSDVRQRDVFVLHREDPPVVIQLERGITIRGAEIWRVTSDPVVLVPGERTVIRTHVPTRIGRRWARVSEDERACWHDYATIREATDTEVAEALEPTPREAFFTAVRERAPRYWRDRGRSVIQDGRDACADAANGRPEGWRLRGPLDGAQTLAWVWEVAEHHGSAKVARLAIEHLCPQHQPVLDAALALGPPPPRPRRRVDSGG